MRRLIYLPLVARNFAAGFQQPFAVVATSAGFRAAYDRNGNMRVQVEVSGTETITYTQEWDVENRLSVVTNTVTGDVTRFVYNGDGARVLREDGGGLTAYIGAVEVHISGTQRLTTSYYFAGGQRIAMRQDGEVTYLHGDHLGSASLATDAGGGKVSEMRYTPFGETRSGAMPTDRQFTGQRHEAGLGLYDFNARFYASSVGRFVSADAIIPDPKNPQALNRYSYVLNNPLKFYDPTGNWWEDPETGALMPGYSPKSLPESWKAGKGSYRDTVPSLCFEQLPLLPTNDATSQWFGATTFAKEHGADWNYSSYCQGFHCGLDLGLANNGWGTDVRAGVYGRVIGVWPDTKGTQPTYRSGPYAVYIKVGEYVVIYGHMDNKPHVKVGDFVTPDTILGGAGNPSGDPQKGNIHLHLEIRKNNTWIYNPLLFIEYTDYMKIYDVIGVNGEFYKTDSWPGYPNPLQQPVIHRGGKSLWP